MKKITLFLSVFFFSLSINAQNQQYTLTLQLDGEAGKDVSVHWRENGLSNQYPNDDFLINSAWTHSGSPGYYRTLMEWDLTSIPKDAIIKEAKLSLFAHETYPHSTRSGANDLWIEKVVTPWVEDSVTHLNLPTTIDVNRAFIPATTNDNQDITNIDMLALVKDMVAYPESNFGVMLKLQVDQYYRRLNFCSSDHEDPTKRPKLEIRYELSSIDEDDDGYFVEEDCDDNNPTVNKKKAPGTACDDGDISTIEDEIQADSCMCMGTTLISLFCLAPYDPVVVGRTNRSVSITWTPITDAVAYTVQVRLKGTETWLATEQIYKARVFIRAPLGEYEYRIKSNCDEEISSYSEIYPLSIPTVGGLETAPTEAKGRSNDNNTHEIVIGDHRFSLAPNPVNTDLTVQYPIDLENASVVIYNYTGQQVSVETQRLNNRGIYTTNVSDLATGFYILSIMENGESVFSQKFIKQ